MWVGVRCVGNLLCGWLASWLVVDVRGVSGGIIAVFAHAQSCESLVLSCVREALDVSIDWGMFAGTAHLVMFDVVAVMLCGVLN